MIDLVPSETTYTLAALITLLIIAAVLWLRGQRPGRLAGQATRDPFDATPDPLILLDAGERVIDMNPAAIRLAGAPARGQPLEELFPALIAPDAGPIALGDGPGQQYRVEHRVVGDPLLGERQVTDGGRLLRLRDLDVTAELERQILLHRGRAHHLFEHTRRALLVLVPETLEIVEANSAALRLLDHDLESLREHSILDYLRNGSTESLRGKLSDATTDPREIGEGRLVLSDGSQQYVELYVSRLEGGDGPRLLLELIDVHRRHEAEANLARQQALSEVELAIDRSTDVFTALDRIADIVRSDLPADSSSVLLWDEGKQQFYQSASTVPEQPHGTTALRARRSSGASRWIVDNGRPVVVNDTRDDPFGPNRMIEEYGIRAYIGVPLLHANKVIGVLYGLERRPRRFTAQEVHFMERLAGAAATTVLKVRRQKNEEDRRKLAETLRAVSTTLSATLDLDEVLQLVMENLGKVILFERAAVLLKREGRLEVVESRGESADETDSLARRVLAGPFFEEIAATRTPIAIPDIQEDPRFFDGTPVNGIHGWLGVPLIANDEVIGLLALGSARRGLYGSHEIDIALTFAGQAAIAIENAQRFGTVQNMAITDPLTNLNNRRHFFQLAEYEFARARRANRPISVIMFDVDLFKRVNDQFGHGVGDQVLKGVADRVNELVRDVDLLARYGGEEFTILLPETPLIGARRVADRVREAVAGEPVETDRGPIAVTVSLGVAQLDDDHETLAELINEADQALYAAKAAGRNRVQTYSDEAHLGSNVA